MGRKMKFSNFLFPESRDPADDGRVIDETLREALLTDELGFDVIWLAEHHFDGICAYVDPVSFAAALADRHAARENWLRGGADGVAPPDPHGRADSLIDHLSKGRLIVGLGRGTAYNIYDYQGFGIEHTEAQARFEESEAIMFKAWKGDAFEHHGEFFNLKLPAFRPVPYTKPHPYVIRAAATEHGMLDIARRGRPFMMNVQSNETTAQRMELYRQTLRSIGQDEATVAKNAEPAGPGEMSSWRKRMPKRNGSPSRLSRPCTNTEPRCASGFIASRACPSCRCPHRERRRPRGWC